MPKYGIHHIVLRDSLPKLLAFGDDAAVNAAGIIQNQMPMAILGSIGPDLFFWGPDYELSRKLLTLYNNINSMKSAYDALVAPLRAIEEAIVEPVEDAVETLLPETIKLIRDAIEETEKTVDTFYAAVGTKLFAGVLEGANILTDAAGIPPLAHQFFQQFVPELQSNQDESQWYWFDMLHYRYTGWFAANLVGAARTEPEKAFAFGYLSHIATDVIGHSFVNQVSGTTYRLNVQRHITAENFMDTWAYDQYYGGESINQTLFDRLGLPENLPWGVGGLLFQAFRDTYHQSPPCPAPYIRDQIDETYALFYEVLTSMTGMTVEPPEEPFSGVADILADALDAFSAPPVPDSPSSTCDFWEIFSKECFEGFFEEIADWFEYIGELLKWCLETIAHLADLLLVVLGSLPICVLLAIVYGIRLLCYEVYREARWVLVQSGFLLPEPDDLRSPVAHKLITPDLGCTQNFENFPSIGRPLRGHLVCPVPQAEQPATAAGFYAPTAEPDRFIWLDPFDEEALLAYLTAFDPEETRSVQSDGRSIGNAVDFTAWMIRHANDPNITEDMVRMVFANWNLDADRGYGYRAWSGEIPQEGEPPIVEREGYLEPLIWPP